MDSASRTFRLDDFIHSSAGGPGRSIAIATDEAAVAVWHVAPGQEVPPHTHPSGQDTWIVISGTADYYKGAGATERIKPGDIAVARPSEVHGAANSGPEPFVFVSVVSPANAGYAPAKI